jgi:RNA polymerase sigma-70 factor (sigma-E family)
VSDRGTDFDDFVAAASTRLVRVAYALTGDRSAAEDLVQDTLERLYVAWPRVDDPRAYTHRALVNHSHNHWRRRARHPELTLNESHDRAVDDSTDRSDDRDVIVRAIMDLPSRQRAVIVLRFLEDLSEADTADALSCSVGTVKSQTSRAMAHLRKTLATDDAPIQARSSR